MNKLSSKNDNGLSLFNKDSNDKGKSSIKKPKNTSNPHPSECIIVDNVEVIACPSTKKIHDKKNPIMAENPKSAEKKSRSSKKKGLSTPKSDPKIDLEAAADAILLADGLVTPKSVKPEIVDAEIIDSDEVMGTDADIIDVSGDPNDPDGPDEADEADCHPEDLSEDLSEDLDDLEGFTDSSIDTFSLNTPAPVSSSKDSLHLYLKEISRFPMLKPEEEQELARRVVESNDRDAAFRLVSSHLRLVVKIAMDFQRRWMQNVLDLIQEGNVGLMRAVNKFDPDKGIKFSYYAAFWIKAYILKFIMNNWRMVKIGTTQVQRKLFYNLNKERQKLLLQGFDPDATMLSERLGVSVEQIHEMDQRLSSSDM